MQRAVNGLTLIWIIVFVSFITQPKYFVLGSDVTMKSGKRRRKKIAIFN